VVFDRVACLDRLGGDENLLQRIIKVFLDDAQLQINKLTEALAVSDPTQVSRLAHKLNGAAGSIGANALRQLAINLEAAAREQATEPLAAWVAPLRQTFEALKRVLERELTAEEASVGAKPDLYSSGRNSDNLIKATHEKQHLVDNPTGLK